VMCMPFQQRVQQNFLEKELNKRAIASTGKFVERDESFISTYRLP